MSGAATAEVVPHVRPNALERGGGGAAQDQYGNPSDAAGKELCVAVSTTALFVADFLASWMSYVGSLVLAHPLDTLRIRWQTIGQRPMDSLRADGVRSLYAGLTTPIVANGPLVALIFALNEFYRAACRWGNVHVLGRTDMADLRCFTTGELAMAGCLAGVSSSLLQCPASTIRIQQQVSAMGGQRGVSQLTVVRRLYAAEGIAGMYRGLPYDAVASGIGRMVYFTSYEVFKGALADHAGGLDPTLQKFIAAGMTSTVGWLSCYPLDVIKNKLQADAVGDKKQFRSFRHCCDVTYRQHGWRGFWTGFGLTVARSLVSSGISLPAFDHLKPKMRALVPRCDAP